MSVAQLEFIAPLIALIALGGFTLAGLKMWLSAKAARQRDIPPQELQGLSEAVDRLGEQVQLLREDVGELQERVDFAERLLARGPGGQRAPRLDAGS